jgi:formate C-acetyltransferase
MVQNRFACYGNDEDRADTMMRRVFTDYAALVARTPKAGKTLRPAGISTFGREIEWAAPGGGRFASPDGHRQGDVLATNFSPSPGSDRKGPTAALQSYCKMDFTRTPNGATLELKVQPDSVSGERGLAAMEGLLRSFVELGGMFVHMDVVDSRLLEDAQLHPEKYPNLSVRIAGWSARFATMNKHWQDMVIARTQQYC